MYYINRHRITLSTLFGISMMYWSSSLDRAELSVLSLITAILFIDMHDSKNESGSDTYTPFEYDYNNTVASHNHL